MRKWQFLYLVTLFHENFFSTSSLQGDASFWVTDVDVTTLIVQVLWTPKAQ